MDLTIYLGDYGEGKIILENGKLVYQSTKLTQKLSPLTETFFALNDDLRIHFEDNTIKILHRERGALGTFTKSKAVEY